MKTQTFLYPYTRMYASHEKLMTAFRTMFGPNNSNLYEYPHNTRNRAWRSPCRLSDVAIKKMVRAINLID